MIDLFPGPPLPGVFLAYRGVHPLADHCPYAYVLRRTDGTPPDLMELWNRWEAFIMSGLAPPGFAIEWQGFPNVAILGAGFDPPRDSFAGFVAEGTLGLAQGWADEMYGFLARSAAHVDVDRLRATDPPRDPFFVSSSGCF